LSPVTAVGVGEQQFDRHEVGQIAGGRLQHGNHRAAVAAFRQNLGLEGERLGVARAAGEVTAE
jgi:hypothetical protein